MPSLVRRRRFGTARAGSRTRRRLLASSLCMRVCVCVWPPTRRAARVAHPGRRLGHGSCGQAVQSSPSHTHSRALRDAPNRHTAPRRSVLGQLHSLPHRSSPPSRAKGASPGRAPSSTTRRCCCPGARLADRFARVAGRGAAWWGAVVQVGSGSCKPAAACAVLRAHGSCLCASLECMQAPLISLCAHVPWRCRPRPRRWWTCPARGCSSWRAATGSRGRTPRCGPCPAAAACSATWCYGSARRQSNSKCPSPPRTSLGSCGASARWPGAAATSR